MTLASTYMTSDFEARRGLGETTPFERRISLHPHASCVRTDNTVRRAYVYVTQL